MKNSQLKNEVIGRTGLIIDPYFSGTKLIWLHENDLKVKDVIAAMERDSGIKLQ